MNILQVMAGAPRGGAETAFVDMCLALRDAGENVRVVTRPNDLRVPQLAKAGIVVHTLPFGGMLDFRTGAGLKRIVMEFRPQIVQTWMSRAAQKTPRWKPSMNIPRYLAVARLGGYYKVAHFRNTDYFVTITPDIRRYLVDEGVAADRIRHINNFADTEDAAAPARRAALDTPEDAVVLLSLSRLHHAKAIDTLLEALAQAPDIWLWIAGEGPDRAALEDLAARLGVAGRVRFLGWRDDRAALLQATDICVFPSRYEPFGTVFVQAWAQKKPLVVTAADGPRQYVRDGEDGLMVPVDDIPALAAALRRLAADPGLRAALAERGHARYLAEFTKAMTVASYRDFYRQIRSCEGLDPAA